MWGVDRGNPRTDCTECVCSLWLPITALTAAKALSRAGFTIAGAVHWEDTVQRGDLELAVQMALCLNRCAQRVSGIPSDVGLLMTGWAGVWHREVMQH